MAAIPLTGAARLFGRFLGSAVSGAAGYALGEATADVLRPRLQQLKNDQNAENPLIPPGAGTMAQGVAQGQIDKTKAAGYASHSGIGPDQFDALIAVANTGPELGAAITLLRRGVWLPDQYTTALNRQAIEPEWYPGLRSLKDEWLTPSQVALGIVRSLIPDPGLMPVTLQTGGKVPAYQQYTQNTAAVEAAGGGIDLERLRVLVGTIGLPASVQQAANAFFRGIIEEGDYNRAILEGNTRPEWAPFLLDQARAYPSVHEYVENRIRGWSDDAAMIAGAGKHGMLPEDTNIVFQNAGRPPSAHQVFIGLRRGGIYNGPTNNIDPAVLKAMQESSIRPEWYNIVAAGLETLPAAFVLRGLTQAHDVTQQQSETLLLHQGWPTDLAASVSAKWYGGTGTTATQKKQTLTHLTDEYLANVLSRAGLVTALTALGYSPEQIDNEIALAEFGASKTERTRNTKLIEKQFVGAKLSEAQARADLAALGWPAKVQDDKIAAWNIERSIALTTLTVAQIEKALKAGALTAATATPLLEDLGEDAAAIATILASNPPKP